MVRDGEICMFPHQLSNGAVNAIAAKENIPVLEATICHLYPNPMISINDIVYALPFLDKAFIGYFVIDYLQELSAFESRTEISIPVRVSDGSQHQGPHRYSPLYHHVEEVFSDKGLSILCSNDDVFQWNAGSFESVKASDLLQDPAPMGPHTDACSPCWGYNTLFKNDMMTTN